MIKNLSSCDATMLLKRELRRRIRTSLSSMPQDSIDRESHYLVQKFVSSPTYKNASSIALYASMPHELNTSSLLHRAFEDSKRVFLPRVVSKENHEMVMLECRSMDELNSWAPNSWKIREPPLEEGRLQCPKDVHLDVVVVPGVAFDALCRRCGQGMGFYDKFLAACHTSSRPMPYTVALALSVQMVDTVPTNESDWKLDEIIHEKNMK